MPFRLVSADITTLAVDAIANAANAELLPGGGVCGAIYRAAGAEAMAAACAPLAPIETGQAVLTPGFGLPARYVIHAVGPVYRGGGQGEAGLLAASYRNSLALAAAHGCRSIAFPLISSGIYGYPRDEALAIATATLRDAPEVEDMDILLVLFERAILEPDARLLREVEAHLAARTREERERTKRARPRFDRAAAPGVTHELREIELAAHPLESIEEVLERRAEPFATALLRHIDARGETDAAVYKRANLSRQLFSKIRSQPGYRPGKRTVLALAIALELNSAETNELLRLAGYALSPSEVGDIIVEYFIERGLYDIYRINELLFHYEQPLLGGVGDSA